MIMTEKRKVGRPTLYKEEYCDIAIRYMSKGKSVTQLSREIDVAKSTIYKWADEYQEFSDALSRGQELSQAYWEDELGNMMYSKEVNAPLVKLYFANRFHWTDKQETKTDHTSSDGSMTPAPTTIELVSPNVESSD